MRYWDARKVYYCQINGRRHDLGRDKKQAEREFHRLMSAPPPKKMVASNSVLAVIDEYLEWCQKNRAAETYRWYLDRLNSFAKTIDPELSVADFRPFHVQTDFRPFHVQKWVDAREGWAKGTCRNAIASVKRSPAP